MAIPLEDNVSDIIGKAQRGLGISDSQLAERSGVSAEKIRKLRDGDFDDDAIELVAPVLKLDAAALRKLAAGKWNPEAIGEVPGLAQFNTTYGDMTVNAYLVWDPVARERGRLRYRGGLQRNVEPNRAGETECEIDSADACASGPRG